MPEDSEYDYGDEFPENEEYGYEEETAPEDGAYGYEDSDLDDQEEYPEPGNCGDVCGGGRGAALRILKPSDGLLAAFFVPVVVMIIVFAQRGIFPFGEESFLRTDMYHQYAPFFSEFQYKLTHGGSLLYSWDIGMGVNFSALFAYYLASQMCIRDSPWTVSGTEGIWRNSS